MKDEEESLELSEEPNVHLSEKEKGKSQRYMKNQKIWMIFISERNAWER
jgi:hypothetical protein